MSDVNQPPVHPLLLVHAEADALANRIDAILPQTQCRQCNYPGCRPYAVAIARGEADINQCPPGGDAGVRQLAELLGVQAKPLNPAHGAHKAKAVAWIDESICIGCTLCIRACPVDAIVGAAKQMHTVVAAECTGCELCIAPCPVDCIRMRPMGANLSASETKRRADRARDRHNFWLARLEREKAEKAERLAAKRGPTPEGAAVTGVGQADPKRAAIAAAIERVKARKAAAVPKNVDSPTGEQQAAPADGGASRAPAQETAHSERQR